MGNRFRFKTSDTLRVYTVLKIVLKLVFTEITKFRTQASKRFQTYWIKYIINGIEQRTTTIQIQYKFPKL